MITDPTIIQDLYSEIENTTNDEIENLIRSIYLARFMGTVSFFCYPFCFSWLSEDDKLSMAIKELHDVCVDCANTIENKNQIKLILQNNPQRTNLIIGIILLLAPAIAQPYSRIPAMAVIGAITLLCRQGIDNFIKD